MNCDHSSIGEKGFRFYECCHGYYLDDKRLTSVTQVIRETLPASYDGVPEATLESARERGVELDALVSRYVVGELKEIPAGTREDVVELFERFVPWWDGHHFGNVAAQVIVNNGEIAGAIDICVDGYTIFDVKCTYDLLPSHKIQVAAYADLLDSSGGAAGGLIHLTKRLKTPRIVPLELSDYADWDVVKAFWRLKRRLS